MRLGQRDTYRIALNAAAGPVLLTKAYSMDRKAQLAVAQAMKELI